MQYKNKIDKSRVEILKSDDFSKCLDCKHISKEWAEIDGINNEFIDDEREVFCPNCLSTHYYLI